jgi:hypothetical protein
MGFPDTACVAFQLSQAAYRPLFEEVWGEGSFDIKFPRETERICATPGGAAVFGGSTTPVPLNASDRTRANTIHDWPLPEGNDRKSRLLAHARGAEQY